MTKLNIEAGVVPQESGCLSFLIEIHTGGKVVAVGDVPPAMIGAKWADVYIWQVILWSRGRAFMTVEYLKTEGPRPWTLQDLANHCVDYPQMWRQIA